MKIKTLKGEKNIVKFLLQDPYLNSYILGHIATRFSKNYGWYGLYEKDILKDVMIILKGRSEYHVMLMTPDRENAGLLLEKVKNSHKGELFLQLSDTASDIAEKLFSVKKSVRYNQYRLDGDILLNPAIKYSDFIFNINPGDHEAVKEFLEQYHPDAWFIKSMLKTKCYYCIRKNNEIQAMAGVHFMSEDLSIASLGNVVTSEKHRGKGYAKALSAYLARQLWGKVQYVGLRAEESNPVSNAIYTKLGFIEHSKMSIITAENC